MPSMKPVLHPFQTPKTMTFPSELQSGASSSLSDNVKSEDALSTPITPPAAYTEFLKALTPVFASPNSASVDFSKFTFDGGRSNSNGSSNTSGNGGSGSTNTNRPPAYSPTSQPTSAVSSTFNFNPDASIRSATASLPPPVPWAASRPRRDPRNLRSLRIPPPPPYSPTIAASPRSATTMRSPYSPSDWQLRYLEGPRSASGRLSVRHVVTHTVTYKRTELEDPPKGKRRKTQHAKEE
ncbi:hypothetical protein ATEIFO6365_0003076400 [Aspergillus terreus]|uniref:Uncharacterized protein n=1 Tax=Aspergillus terreus TaxID=33178 RepID=A0A5M3YWF6_ASPTE|nr:hypothetical protein ATETN484_0003071000 [Aspergillus terreus]GFF14696.1 hypothetical protein ATEIFO6365_0003076400 [Aspergillus terreus]